MEQYEGYCSVVVLISFWVKFNNILYEVWIEFSSQSFYFLNNHLKHWSKKCISNSALCRNVKLKFISKLKSYFSISF